VKKPSVKLYSAPGCCLCDEMKAQLAAVGSRIPFDLEVLDISTDEALEARFRAEIPVLFIDGRKVAKYRIATEALRWALLEGE
jgi:glutaredoxin